MSSAIFQAVDADINDGTDSGTTYLGKNGVAWVLRFGGLCTLVRVPCPTSPSIQNLTSSHSSAP